MIEYVDHLHEHFVDPVVIRDGRYRAPTAPGLLGRDDAARRSPRYRYPGRRRLGAAATPRMTELRRPARRS